MNKKCQQRGQINFAKHSIMSEPGNPKDVLSLRDKDGNAKYMRLPDGQIIKLIK